MFENLNWIAIALALVASMAIGAGWYGLLAGPWMTASQFTEEQKQKVQANDQPSIYAVAAAGHLIMAIVLSGIVFHSGGSEITIGDGITVAILCWLGFVLTTMATNHRFQMRTWSLTVIDAAHFLVVMVAQGAIIGWFGFSG